MCLPGLEFKLQESKDLTFCSLQSSLACGAEPGNGRGAIYDCTILELLFFHFISIFSVRKMQNYVEKLRNNTKGILGNTKQQGD